MILKQHKILRCRYTEMLGQRCDAQTLAAEHANALKGMSSGSQPFLRERLATDGPQLVFVSGSEDPKFAKLAKQLTTSANELPKQTWSSSKLFTLAPCLSSFSKQLSSSNDACKAYNLEIKDCGHAVHLERPEALLRILMLVLSCLGDSC